MKKISFLFALFALCASQLGAFTYNGKTIANNTEFTRAQIGSSPSSIKEISGMACSRTTPGYFWVELDDPDDDNKIYALNSDGSLKLTLTLSGLKMRDWEDIAVATTGGKNYILIGGFGDNDCAFNNNYHIYVFEEPTIGSGSTASVASSAIADIKFGYPDNKPHNAEALMYDPVSNLILVVDKWVDRTSAGSVPNTMYSTPFRTTSGTVTLSTVQSLGTGKEFITLTAADISADGQHILIKNEKDMLYWRRQSPTESFAVAIAREPQYMSAYSAETQGESVAWSTDALKFYTVSDEKGASKMYSYTRPNIPAIVLPVETPTGVNASATDKSVTVTWNAVDGAEKYIVKLCHTEGGNSGGSTLGTSFTQVLNSYTGSSDSDIKAPFTVGNVTVNATNDLPVRMSSSSGTVGGISYTKYLDLRGGGTTAGRSVQFATDGAGTLTVYNNCTDNDRVLVLFNGSAEQTSTNNTAVFAISGAGNYYIYSQSAGIRIYAIDFAGGGSSASVVCDDSYETTSTSITIPNLDPETEYTYRVKAVKGTQESDYSAAKTVTTQPSGTGIVDVTDASPIRIEGGWLTAKQPIAVYNTLGQLVITSTVSPVNISSLKGIYIVRAGTASLKVKF